MSDYYIAIPHDDYVVHHGILGQKWGVRRYQNADGSYTAAGRARYLSDVRSRGGNVKKAAAKWDAEVAKQQKPKKKSDHRLKLEAKYKASGMTKKQAEEAADKRIQKEKKIAIGAGIAAAAAGTAYGLYRHHDYATERIVGSVYDWNARVLNDPEINKKAKKFVAREMTHDALKKGAAVGAISASPMVLEAYAISKSKPARAMSLHKAGVSDEDIANQLNIPVSTVKKISRPNNNYRRYAQRRPI